MKSELKICIPFYKMAYSAAFVMILAFIRPVIYVNEIGVAMEVPMAFLTAVFCADTYLAEVQSKRAEIFRLYDRKRQITAVFCRLWIQISYLSVLSFVGYGMFYCQKPVRLTTELTNGASFGIFCIAIIGTIAFWSALSVTLCGLWRNIWFGMGSVFILWSGFFSKSGEQIWGKWNPFSYTFCDVRQITEWSWLYGKAACMILTIVLLLVFPIILEKRG